MCLTVNFVKSLRTPFFIDHPWWLLLLKKRLLKQLFVIIAIFYM